jgi:hypothetical protein
MKPTGMLSRKYLTGKMSLLLKKAEHCGQPSGGVVVLALQDRKRDYQHTTTMACGCEIKLS